MQVTVKDNYLNVRVGAPSVNAPSYQYLAPGSQIEVDGQLYPGDLYDGVSTWMKDAAGNYYWSGGVNHTVPMPDVLKIATPAPNDKITFNWFNQLKIQNIWDQFNERGDKVKVAVLDTGYNFSNPDLSNKITATEMLLTSDNYPGIDLVMNDQSNDFHGTRCASLVGATNSLNWIVGIAPECELIVGKISINEEILDFDYIINGIKWAISQNADIISISYAYDGLKPNDIITLNQLITDLTANIDVLIFAAAGNSGSPQISADLYPASFDGCVSVGASTSAGQISSITVLSNKTIIHAPGENIESYDGENVPTPESGTSFSTPIVAAVCALSLSYQRKKNNTNNWDKTSLLQKIYDTGDIIPGASGKKIINPTNLFNNL